MFGGLIALFVRYRQEALAVTGGEWKPADIKIPEVPTNVNLLAFLFIGIFAQWGVYAAKRQHKGGVGMASGLVGLLGVAVINSLSFVYVQMGMGIADGTYQLFFYAVTGAFLILENTSDAARALVRGKASVGDTLELHEMKRENGMMRMSPVPRIDIPAKGSVALRPGGYHLMLFGLKAPLAAGDTVRLTLTFDDGTTAQVKAPVRPMQGMPQ